MTKKLDRVTSITPQKAHEKLVDTNDDCLIDIITDGTKTQTEIAWAAKALLYRTQYNGIDLRKQIKHMLSNPALQMQMPPIYVEPEPEPKPETLDDLLRTIPTNTRNKPFREAYSKPSEIDGVDFWRIRKAVYNNYEPIKQVTLYIVEPKPIAGWQSVFDDMKYNSIEECKKFIVMLQNINDNTKLQDLNPYDRGFVESMMGAYERWLVKMRNVHFINNGAA